MTTITTTATTNPATPPSSNGASTVAPARRPGWRAPLLTLARRRLALSARTPRELLLPLLNPLLFALVVVPALADTLGGDVGDTDYMTYAAVSAVGLLVPLSCATAGLGVVVDRLSGAQRDLLAAPVPRPLIVAGNLLVALLLSTLQLAVLMGAAALRGAEFDMSATGIMWFVAAAAIFAVACTPWPRRSPTAPARRRSTSASCPPWRSCRTSSPARCSPSARCRPDSR
jgi:ABC-2 type transporter